MVGKERHRTVKKLVLKLRIIKKGGIEIMNIVQEVLYDVVIEYADDLYDQRDLLVILGAFKCTKQDWVAPKRRQHNVADIVSQKLAENTYQLELLTYQYLTRKAPYSENMLDAYEKLKEERHMLFDDMYASK